MNNQKYFDMIREIKDAAFATVDRDGHPQVRIIDVMFVEDEKLYFVTARGKDFYRELTDAGEVAVTGLNKEWQTIRLSGKIKKEDQRLLDRVFEQNPSMNDVYPGESRYILDVFCLYEGDGEFFDLGQEPIHRQSFSFGKDKAKQKGFRITGRCTGCGLCQKDCPQQCIREGAPYEIIGRHCLHCGLCAEKCPVNAIIPVRS